MSEWKQYTLDNLMNSNSLNITSKRYMSLEKFVDMIMTESICFSRIDQFEDKSEGTHSKDYILQKYDLILDLIFEQRPNVYPDGRNEFDKIYSLIKEDINEHNVMKFSVLLIELINKNEFDDKTYRFLMLHINDIINSHMRTYCYCYSKKNDEDFLLWKTYTNNGKGLCIEFDNYDLLDNFMNVYHLDEIGNITFLCNEVQYYSNCSEIPTDGIMKSFYKKNYFAGENEIRLNIETHSNVYNKERYFARVDISKLINKIILSPFLSSWEARVYINVIKAIWSTKFETANIPSIVNSNVGKPVSYMMLSNE